MSLSRSPMAYISGLVLVLAMFIAPLCAQTPERDPVDRGPTSAELQARQAQIDAYVDQMIIGLQSPIKEIRNASAAALVSLKDHGRKKLLELSKTGSLASKRYANRILDRIGRISKAEQAAARKALQRAQRVAFIACRDAKVNEERVAGLAKTLAKYGEKREELIREKKKGAIQDTQLKVELKRLGADLEKKVSIVIPKENIVLQAVSAMGFPTSKPVKIPPRGDMPPRESQDDRDDQ